MMRATARKLRRSLVRTDVTAIKSPAPARLAPFSCATWERSTPGGAASGSGFPWYRLGLLPRTVQLCIHCRESPAGFWVSRKDGKTVRRPWCLSCCDGLDRGRCDVTPFSV
jgi:hypothetical protein